jgi:hypothetical protein
MSNSVKELNKLLQEQYGYNLVALPSSGLQPLQLLYKKHTGIIGFFKNLFEDTVVSNSNSFLNDFLYSKRHPYPNLIENTVNNDIQNTVNSKLSADASIELMLKMLKIPSLSAEEKSKLSTIINQENDSSFSLSGNAKEKTFKQTELDSFVTKAKIKQELGITFMERLKGNQLYIVTSILESNTFSLSSKELLEASADLSFSEFKNLLEAKSKFKIEKGESSAINFKGDMPITLAFKAVKLLYEEGNDGEIQFRIKDKESIVVKGNGRERYDYMEVDSLDDIQ